MAEFKLGRLRFVWQGEWTTGTAYVKDDIVRYGGSSYVCVGAHTAASDFYTNFDAGKWELMTSGLQWQTEPWTSARYYPEGSVVRYGGKIFVAVDGHTSSADFYTDFDAGDWQLFVDGIQWKSNPWGSATLYKEGDLVRHGGRVYICVDGHTSSANFEADITQGKWQLFADGSQWVNTWTASTLYKVGDVARVSGKTYICVNEHTANATQRGGFYNDIVNWNLYTDGNTYRGVWDAESYYWIGDIVSYGGKSYITTEGHEADADFYIDLDANRWTLLNDGQQWITAEWTNNQWYKEGDLVRHGGKVYICVNGHTSSAGALGFNTDLAATKWQLFSDGIQWKGAWVSGTTYKLGDIVSYGGRSYTAIVAHTAAADFYTDFDSTRWDLVADGVEWKDQPWQTTTLYKEGDIVRYGGKTYICVNGHTSDGSVNGGFYTDISNWQLFSDGTAWLGNWTTGIYYKVGDIVRYNGFVYVCNTGHLSAATTGAGLEADQAKWDLYSETFKFRQEWTPGVRYVVNDVVKFGSSLYICTTFHVSGSTFDESKWSVFVGGLEFEDTWSPTTEYQLGDVVTYGGYSYVAVNRNTGNIPPNEPTHWELLTVGFKVQGEWVSTTSYKVGDLVRYGGNTYVAISNTTPGQEPVNADGTTALQWELVAGGFNWRNEWASGTDYRVGDTVRWVANTYRAVKDHNSDTNNSQPDLDVTNEYWNLISAGDENNVLARRGDLLTRGASENTRIPRGQDGQILKINNLDPVWDYFNLVDKVYYVKPDGVDAEDRGTTLETAFASVKYATEYILADEANRAPATIFVKTGYYYEETPIRIPANVAIVGDELRSTRIIAAPEKGVGTITVMNGGSGYSLRPAAEVLLTANRTFLQSEVIAWINENIATGSSYWNGFTYNQSYCYRDIGLIIDAITYDLQFGGNEKTVIAARRYWKGNENKVAGQERQTIDALNRLVIIINSYIFTNTTFSTSQTDVAQVTNGNDAEVNSDTRVSALMSIITTVINTSLRSLPTIEYATNPVEVVFDAPTAPNGQRAEGYAVVRNGAVTSVVVTKAGSGYILAPEITILGSGTDAFVTCELKSKAYALGDMFYMRDGSGLRNCTLAGLSGTLTAANQYLTKRPTAGAYTSLDPGTGPGDESVWIVYRSPYVQNVTTFGDACVGLKVDGLIHNGGNKTIVCNDYTQVLNDGIGIWATNQGRVENVSVFCYYNHIGYLAENGGVIRSTNGNNSYGTYGVAAEGVDPTEVSRIAKVDNRRLDALVANVLTDGNGIISVEYSNAGENYTVGETTYTWSGTGVIPSITGVTPVIQNGGIKEVRVLDSGLDWLTVVNNAQGGDATYIRLSASDIQASDAYVGQRIVIIDGQGVGQHAYVTSFDGGTKELLPAKESFTPLTITASSNVTNRFTTNDTSSLTLNMPIQFNGTTFGGIDRFTVYYVKSIISSTEFTISTVSGGTTLPLDSGTGSMQLHANGWETFDGRAVEVVLDTTTRYTIEPRVVFSTGSDATATGAISKGLDTITPTSNGTNYQVAPDVVISGTEPNATGATATATISGSVSEIVVRNGGSGFTGTPAVQFIGGGGTSAAATAHVVTSIGTVEVTNRGSGYSVPPMVQISGPGYNGDAYISANITGIVGDINVDRPGEGYTSVPEILIVGGGGVGAAAEAQLDAEVTGFTLIDGGEGYADGTTVVTISRAAGDTTGAGAEATPIINNGVITGFTLVSGGSGYTKPPIVTISNTGGGIGRGASATANILGGIASITVVNGGRGYITYPSVTIVSNSGYGATATAIITNAVDSLDIINGGSGFTGEVTLNIVGNSGFTYDEAKCSRDVGLIVDAVTTDMVFGTNGASITAGLAYLRSYSSVVLSTQKSQTIAAINKTRDDVLARTGNSSARSRITANFGIITNIINQGAGGVPALDLPNPSNVSDDVIDSAAILQANKEFMKAEVNAWIQEQMQQNVAPFVSSFYYDPIKCARDIGYLVDALTYDLLYGGNTQTKIAAEAYYIGATSYVPGQEDETVAAYNYLRGIIDDVILGNAITPTSGNGIAQVTSATMNPGSNAEVTVVQGLIDIVTDVVIDGLDNAPATLTVLPTFANGNATLYGIKQSIDADIAQIQDDTISFINLTYLGGSGATAVATTIRQVSHITIDNPGSGFTSAPTVAISGGGGSGALASAYISGTITAINKTTPGANYTTDPTIAFAGGKNFKSVIAGEAYYKNASSLIAISPLQLTETLAGIDYIKTLVAAIGNNANPATEYQTQLNRVAGSAAPVGAVAQADFWIDAIETIIENGEDNSNAATILSSNKSFIEAEVAAWTSIQGFTANNYYSPTHYVSAVFSTGQVQITTSDTNMQNAITGLTVGKTFTGISGSTNYTFTVSGSVTTNSGIYTIPVSQTTTGSHALSNMTIYTGTGWTFTTADVKKRTRVLVEALVYDLTNSGVSRSIAMGQKYGFVASSESAAHNQSLLDKLSALVSDIIINEPVVVLNGEGATQVFESLIVAEQTAPTAVSNLVGLAKTLVGLNSTTGDSGNSTFASLLVDNKNWIKAEVIEYIKINYPSLSYNQELCARDVGLIVDAIAYDITNSQSARAVATATTTNVLSEINISSGGSGYGAGTTVSFSGDVGTGQAPAATPIITKGVITGFNITQAGSGFTAAPAVTINAGAGSGAYARAYVLGGLLQEIRMIHPGSGYTASPYVSLVDPNNTIDAELQARVGNGVLDQPTFVSRGTGFVTASVSISGDGYADIYQTGEYIYVKNLTNIPTPGANVQFEGNTDFYKLVAIRDITGPTGVIGGKDLLSANKQFIQAQIIAYINNSYPTLVYNQTLCKRDVGYIIDAMVSDVFGDTEKGIEAGKAYFRNASALKAITNGAGAANAQKTATLAALAKILDYAEDIVQNITVTRNQLTELQVKEPLITNGADAIPAFTETIGIITNIINNGTTIRGVADLLTDNKPYIEAEILAFIATTYPDFIYNEELCGRDVGYIVDAIAYDLYGGVARSQDAGLRYYSSASSLIAITDQKAETVAAINHIAAVCQAVASNQAPAVTYQVAVPRISDPSVVTNSTIQTKIGTCVNTITNIINNGVGVLPQGQYKARLQLNPPLTVSDVPADSVQLTIRSKYSQVRLSGHDFLNVGTGNKSESNYPGIPVNPVAQENEVMEGGGGRCFYTSTDQDGNFRVGELFKVEQATGVATLNAQAFNLSGLNELSLGGITVGGTNVVIKEFSTDGTFLANSDNIVPTQKAIKTFISSQLGSGGGNLAVNAITAGDIQITGTEITTNAGLLTINSSGGTSVTDTSDSVDKDTGALVVEGGVGIEKNLNVGGSVGITGDLTVTGDLVVNGNTGTLNIGTLEVEDVNITIAKSAVSSAQANGAGLTVLGPTTPATITYANVDDSWNMNKALKATSIQNTPIGSTTKASGAFTTLSATGNTTVTSTTGSTTTNTGALTVTGGVGIGENLNVGGIVTATSGLTSNGTTNLTPAGSNVTVAPTGAGQTIINSGTRGNIDNMNVGASTRGTGAFTTLTANGATTFTAGTSSSSSGTGTVVVTGGVGVSENLYVGGNTVITGDLTVNGTTTTVNSTTVTVDDITLELGSVASPTDTTANGGGIILKGTTDKSILWDSANTNWTSSENFNLTSGKTFKIANTTVLTSTQVFGRTPAGTSAGDIATIDATQTLTNKSLSDSTTYFIDNADASKKMQFEVSGVATGITRTLTVPNQNGTIAVTSDIGNGTLTLNVSGNGLSGSQTFTANQGSSATFTVTSNATNANTANTIVYRDASGNFSAGTITATLSGNASTATNVAWSGVTGKPTRSDWSTVGSISNVVGQLSWKNFGNNHTIFDASAGTSPDGTSVNNTNPGTYWSSTYPTLMGWNGSGTYGVRVDVSRLSESCSGNAATATTATNSNQLGGVAASSFPYSGASNIGDWQFASSTNGSTSYSVASIELRESNFGSGSGYTAPRLAFHWGGVVASQIGLESSGRIAILDNPGTGYANLICSAFTATSVTETSSIVYKENVNPITDALDAVLSLVGVTYDRKDGSRKNEAGLIAEEVSEVLPNLITYNEEGKPDGIQYTKLTAYLVEAVKALKAEIDQLKGSK